MNHRAWQRWVILGGKVAIAIGLVMWLVLSDRVQLSRLATVRLGWPLVVLFSLVAGSMILPAIRWWWLLRIQGLNEPLGKIFRLTWSGYLAALILPGAASGDLAKGYLILRDNSQTRARAFSTVLTDRFLGLHSLFALGALSAVWMTLSGGVGLGNQQLLLATLLPFVGMTGCVLGLMCGSTRAILFQVMPRPWRDAWNESFLLYCSRLPALAGCFLLSIVNGLMAVLSFAAAGKTLGLLIHIDTALIAGPLIVVANCLPITPGGIGLAEATSSELFSQLGAEGGAELMLLVRVFGAAVSIIGMAQFLIPSRNIAANHVRDAAMASRLGAEGKDELLSITTTELNSSSLLSAGCPPNVVEAIQSDRRIVPPKSWRHS